MSVGALTAAVSSGSFAAAAAYPNRETSLTKRQIVLIGVSGAVLGLLMFASVLLGQRPIPSREKLFAVFVICMLGAFVGVAAIFAVLSLLRRKAKTEGYVPAKLSPEQRRLIFASQFFSLLPILYGSIINWEYLGIAVATGLGFVVATYSIIFRRVDASVISIRLAAGFVLSMLAALAAQYFHVFGADPSFSYQSWLVSFLCSASWLIASALSLRVRAI